jgi:hypothetical protein
VSEQLLQQGQLLPVVVLEQVQLALVLQLARQLVFASI